MSTWSQEDLVAAVHDIRRSYRRAEAAYGKRVRYMTMQQAR